MAGPPGQVIRGTSKGKMKLGDPKSKSHGEAYHAGMGTHLHLLSSFIIIAQIYMKSFSQSGIRSQVPRAASGYLQSCQIRLIRHRPRQIRDSSSSLGIAQVPPFQVLEGDIKTKRCMSQTLGNTCLYLKGKASLVPV